MGESVLKLIVDGIVYGRQRFGGINAMFNAVLPRLATAHNVSVKLLLPRRVVADVPNGPVRHARREVLPEKTGLSWKLDNWIYGPSSRMVNSLLRDAQVGYGRNTVFQSTYFTWTNRRIAHVATAYDMNHELFPELYDDEWGHWLRRQYRAYLTRATRIVAISAKTKRDIQNFYRIDEGRIDIAHLAVDQSSCFPEDAKKTDTLGFPDEGWLGRYLLYVGGRCHYKNFPLVLHALAKLPTDACRGVVVAGHPLSPSENELIASLRISDRVVEIHNPSDDTLRRLYSSSLAFVYPSLHEGFGVPLLEAMACRTAVVAADTEIFREVAAEAALFFEPESAEALASAVKRLNEGRERDSLVERGANRSAEFSWDRCAAQLCQSYSQAVEDWRRL